MFFLGPGYVQSIVHNFIRHSAQKKKKIVQKKWGWRLCVQVSFWTAYRHAK